MTTAANMKPLPVQQRALKKRTDLLVAATSCFEELGYAATTAKTIAQRAGVATGSFYQYFTNKDEVLAIIAQQRYDYLRRNIESAALDVSPGNVESEFRRVLTLIHDFHCRDRRLHMVLEQRRFVDNHLAEIVDAGDHSLEQRVIAYVRRFEIPEAEAIAFTLIAMVEGLIHRHVFSEPRLASREQVLRLGSQLLSSYFQSHIRNSQHEHEHQPA